MNKIKGDVKDAQPGDFLLYWFKGTKFPNPREWSWKVTSNKEGILDCTMVYPASQLPHIFSVHYSKFGPNVYAVLSPTEFQRILLDLP